MSPELSYKAQASTTGAGNDRTMDARFTTTGCT